MIGFINIIKPTGVSSGLIVNKIKRITGEKVGHLGTLDLAASGVLSIAVGKATRFFDYFLNKDKEYTALAKFGVLTDTLDSDGVVIKRDDKNISLNQVQKIADTLIGKVEQMPPLYSAKNINGMRAYEAARENRAISLSPKKVQIYDIKIEKTSQNNMFKLKIHCSSGTYVRSIVRDIAEKLGTIATTVCIIRTRSGAFKLENAHVLEDVKNNIESALIGINDVLNMKEINLSEDQKCDLANGKTVCFELVDGEYLAKYNGTEFSVVVCRDGKIRNKIYLYEGD